MNDTVTLPRAAVQALFDSLDHIEGGMPAIVEDAACALATALDASPAQQSGELREADEVLGRAQAAWKRFFYPEPGDFVEKCGCLAPTGVPLRVADSLREVLNVIGGNRLTDDPMTVRSLLASTTPPQSREAVQRVADAMARDTTSEAYFMAGDNKAGWEQLAKVALASTEAPVSESK